MSKLIDMRYHVDYMEDTNYTYKVDYDNCDELESGVLYDKNSSEYDIIYMAWAANLLPHEFNFDWALRKREPVYYMIRECLPLVLLLMDQSFQSGCITVGKQESPATIAILGLILFLMRSIGSTCRSQLCNLILGMKPIKIGELRVVGYSKQSVMACWA